MSCRFKFSPKDALGSANRALEYDPGNVKALYRRAKALIALGGTAPSVSLASVSSALHTEPKPQAAQPAPWQGNWARLGSLRARRTRTSLGAGNNVMSYKALRKYLQLEPDGAPPH